MINVDETLNTWLPDDLSDPEVFQDWYYGELRSYVMETAVRVHGRVIKSLDELKKQQLLSERCQRDFWFTTGIDKSTLIKSVGSIRSKLARDLSKVKEAPVRLTEVEVRKRILAFPDLARFRIVCDLLSDMERCRICLIGAEQHLFLDTDWQIEDFKNYISNRELRRGGKGHRAQQFAVAVPHEAGITIRIEIQLMTLLQHAWDRRNHPLYEHVRENRELPVDVELSDLAIAETLYLLDRQGDQNWRMFLDYRNGEKS